jgi:hypothetical protein
MLDGVTIRPTSPESVAALVVDRILAVSGRAGDGGRVRVAMDGHPSTDPARWADALVDPLRTAGRPVVRVSARDFMRPASLRFERGRESPDALYEDWVDLRTLGREVLEPLGPCGDGRYLPSLRDPVTDRSTRAVTVEAPPGAVLVLDGWFLLGAGLDFELSVHLAARPATLERRTSPDERWTLSAYARYGAEVGPEEVADVVVRVDDPRHPAVSSGGSPSL